MVACKCDSKYGEAPVFRRPRRDQCFPSLGGTASSDPAYFFRCCVERGWKSGAAVESVHLVRLVDSRSPKELQRLGHTTGPYWLLEMAQDILSGTLIAAKFAVQKAAGVKVKFSERGQMVRARRGGRERDRNTVQDASGEWLRVFSVDDEAGALQGAAD